VTRHLQAVTRAIEAVKRESTAPDGSAAVGAVWLSGLLHADERRAMKAVARQLCEAFACSFARGASCDDNLTFLRAFLTQLARADKAVVFVLEDFHLFMRRSKPTTLYSLLDVLQVRLGVEIGEGRRRMRGRALRVPSLASHVHTALASILSPCLRRRPACMRQWLRSPAATTRWS